MTEVPSSGELYRRLLNVEEALKEGFNGVNSRLDGFPTEQTIIALFQVRDSQISAIHKRLDHLSRALEIEREERHAADTEIEQESATAKRWAATTALTGIMMVIGIVSLVLSLVGK